MSGTDPRVTAILTTYNEAEYVAAAVESLLDQTLDAVEIVAVDDGSTDATPAILREYADLESCRVELCDHEGRSAALNRAIELARAEYVAVVDPDDLSRADRLERQAAFLDSHPEVGLVGSAYRADHEIRGESYVRRYPVDDASIRRAMAKYVPVAHSSMMARATALREAGLYDESREVIVDLDLMIRVADRYEVANVDEPLVTRTIHRDSSFRTMYSRIERRWELCKANARAIRTFDLPRRYYVYPLGHLAYHYLPNVAKRWVRRTVTAVDEVSNSSP